MAAWPSWCQCCRTFLQNVGYLKTIWWWVYVNQNTVKCPCNSYFSRNSSISWKNTKIRESIPLSHSEITLADMHEQNHTSEPPSPCICRFFPALHTCLFSISMPHLLSSLLYLSLRVSWGSTNHRHHGKSILKPSPRKVLSPPLRDTLWKIPTHTFHVQRTFIFYFIWRWFFLWVRNTS